MRIAIISKASKLGGGGSLVASKLAKLLRSEGHFCHHFRRDKEFGYAENESSIYGESENTVKWLNHRTRKLGLQELVPWEYFHLKSEILRLKIDLVHIHDTTTAISPYTVGALSEYVPVVWTLHDFSPFTGGCVYPMGCEKFKMQCGKCPQGDRWPLKGGFDFTRANRKLKKWILKKPVNFISPSRFLMEEAISAGIKQESISVIPNSVDTDVFHPIDKDSAKRDLALEQGKFTILLLAFEVNSPFKGVDDALNVLNSLNGKFQVLVVGRIKDSQKSYFENIPCVFTGFVDSAEKLNVCYNAADIFINCSKADNLPLVVLESLAAGTPVYGYATGGIPEMVENGKTGELVTTGDWQSLVRKVTEILTKSTSKLSHACRESVLDKFSDNLFINKTVVHYRRLTERTSDG